MAKSITTATTNHIPLTPNPNPNKLSNLAIKDISLAFCGIEPLDKSVEVKINLCLISNAIVGKFTSSTAKT